MNKIEVTTHHKDGTRNKIDGYLVVPGLAVHKTINTEGVIGDGWMVTHLASGWRIGGSFNLRKQAVDAATAYGPLADWTLPGEELPKDVGAETIRIRNRILNGGAEARVGAEPKPEGGQVGGIPSAPAHFREVTPLTNEPVRANHTLYLAEVEKLRYQFEQRRDLLLTTTQVDEIQARINKGIDWLRDNRGNVSPAKYKKAEELLARLKEERAHVLFANDLPVTVLEEVEHLVRRTSAMALRIPGAYIRVVIPDVLTFEADLVYEDIPF